MYNVDASYITLSNVHIIIWIHRCTINTHDIQVHVYTSGVHTQIQIIITLSDV